MFFILINDKSDFYLQILKFRGPSVCQSAVKEAMMASLASLPAILDLIKTATQMKLFYSTFSNAKQRKLHRSTKLEI